MFDWWSSLEFIEKIFYSVAIISSLALFVRFLLDLFGISSDIVNLEADPASMLDHDSGLGVLSSHTIIAFAVGFGWSGVILSKFHSLPIFASVILAVLVGCVFGGIVIYLISAINRLTASGNVDSNNAKGCSGVVYLTVPAKRSGQGYVKIKIQGRLREYPAVTEENEDLVSNTPIKVSEVLESGIMLIHKL